MLGYSGGMMIKPMSKIIFVKLSLDVGLTLRRNKMLLDQGASVTPLRLTHDHHRWDHRLFTTVDDTKFIKDNTTTQMENSAVQTVALYLWLFFHNNRTRCRSSEKVNYRQFIQSWVVGVVGRGSDDETKRSNAFHFYIRTCEPPWWWWVSEPRWKTKFFFYVSSQFQKNQSATHPVSQSTISLYVCKPTSLSQEGIVLIIAY